MTRDEVDTMAADLASKAANNMKRHIPENIEDIDMDSFAAGMRFARHAFLEALKAHEEASQLAGRPEQADTVRKLIDGLANFPIIGED